MTTVFKGSAEAADRRRRLLLGKGACPVGDEHVLLPFYLTGQARTAKEVKFSDLPPEGKKLFFEAMAME